MNNTELVAQIERLKKEKNAIIMAHYYTRPEVQDIADFVGDSLALAQVAAKTDAEVIIGGKVLTLCGYESEEYLQRISTGHKDKYDFENPLEKDKYYNRCYTVGINGDYSGVLSINAGYNTYTLGSGRQDRRYRP